MVNDNEIDTSEDGPLTDKMEHYCQLRASGYTRSKAGSIAFETKHPRQRAFQTEHLPKCKARIEELKAERAEAFGLSQEEQIRKYHEIYQDAMSKGSLNTAMKALERIDAIGGFEIKKSMSLSLKANQGANIKNEEGDIQEDLKRFSNILTSHKPQEVIDLKPLEAGATEGSLLKVTLDTSP